MTANPHYELYPSRLLGRAMLDAWLCGDRLQLSKKLRDVRSFRWQFADSIERERLEVLKAIACGMTLSSDLFATRSIDPRLGSWINLLDHLANPAGDAN